MTKRENIHRGGLLDTNFLVGLPRGVDVVINRHNPTDGNCRLLVDTPSAAEIIKALAESDAFKAKPREKAVLLRTASKIAGRYSGH